jgi:hypothetical protein
VLSEVVLVSSEAIPVMPALSEVVLVLSDFMPTL